MSVYFIRAGNSDAVKIGYAANAKKRLADLQVANHERLRLVREVPGTIDTEKAFHAKYAKLHIRGDWFTWIDGMLTDELGEITIDGIRSVIRLAGGHTKLAIALDVAPPSIHSWTRVPADRVVAVSEITGIPPHELRPDVFPAPAPEAAA